MDDMDPFAQAVEGWHDFYVMVGTAAATLVGLLFVSLSLNADVITGEANAGSRVLAEQTFANFLSVLLFAVLFLIPDQGPRGLGLPLVGIGSYGLYRTVRRLPLARRTHARAWGRGSVARHVGGSALCYLALLAVAVSVLLGQTAGLYWLVPVMILLIVEASRNAWDLLVQLRSQGTET
jgi:hypothetical protein